MQQLQRLPRQVLGQEAELLGVLIPRRACGVFVARLAATFASVRFFCSERSRFLPSQS